MPQENLPDGLRSVLVYVIESVFTSAPNTALDMSLMRIANIGMQRKLQRDVDDALLVIVVGSASSAVVEKIIAAYGFPNATVACLEIDDDENHGSDDGLISLLIESEISNWLSKEHPGALGCLVNEYDAVELWWSGVENDGRALEYPFDPSDFAAALPDTHRRQSATWLTILARAIDLDSIQGEVPHRLGHDIAAAWAATLCEWLHGFEAASENGYNRFGYESNSILFPTDFYLGFELARLTNNEIQNCCEDSDWDVDTMQSVALKAITEDQRGELRAALSDFFGGDGALFWVLHSAIWPNLEHSMTNNFDLLLGSSDYENLARIDQPWRFVVEGWHDSAEE